MASHGPTGRKVPFSPGEVSAIRAGLALTGTPRDRALFEVGLSTMLRSGDLLRLRVSDATDHTGAVAERVTVKQEKASRRNSRTVVCRLSETARQAVADLIGDEGKTLPTDYLFTRPGCPHGKPLCTMQLRTLVKRWAAAAGIDPNTVAAHSLRRTRPALIYAETKDVEAVRILLGHANLDSTSSYLGIGQAQALTLSARYDI